MKRILDNDYIPHGALVLTNKSHINDFSLQKIDNNNGHLWELEIHPVDFCPLNCKDCSYSKRHHNIEVNYDSLIPYVNACIENGVQSIFLSGGGDPCNWSQLNSFLQKYNPINRNYILGISTNLFTIQDLQALTCINHFQIHVIGYDRDSTITECGIDAFDRFTDNYHLLFKNINNQTTVVMKVLVNNTSFHFIPKYLEYIHQFPVDTIVIKTIQDFNTNNAVWNKANNAHLRTLVLNHPLTNTFDYVIDNLNDAVFDNPIPKECYIANKGLYRLVRTNGDIYPCVAGTVSEYNKIGSILTGISNESIDFSYKSIKKRCPLRACRHYRFDSYIEKKGFCQTPGFSSERPLLL